MGQNYFYYIERGGNIDCVDPQQITVRLISREIDLLFGINESNPDVQCLDREQVHYHDRFG